MHRSANAKRDSRVNIGGFWFHASCAPAVAEANRRLRRELGASPWELRLPDGRVLGIGELLMKDGTIVGDDVSGFGAA